jgi:hypothetical protein
MSMRVDVGGLSAAEKLARAVPAFDVCRPRPELA